MKKLILFFTVIISISIIAFSVYTMNSVPEKTNMQTREIQNPMYVLKEHGGKLAVFNSHSDETPLVVYDVYIHLLPEADIELLRLGVSVYDEETLQRTLEDFGL